MSLSCLNCRMAHTSDSDLGHGHSYEKQKSIMRGLFGGVSERSWSGNLVPSPYEHITRDQMIIGKKGTNRHRRLHSTGAVAMEGRIQIGTGEPRLLRSGGMRRDWSFDNLKEREDEIRNEGRGT